MSVENNMTDITSFSSFVVPEGTDQGILADFIVESAEHLEASDLGLLTLETAPGDRGCLDSVFRAFHSIKGVAGFLGLEGIKTIAHEAENLLDRIRDGEIALGDQVMDCCFDTVAFLKTAVGHLKTGLDEAGDNALRERAASLRSRLQGLLTGDPEQPKRLGDILTESGAVTPEVLQAALADQEKAGGKLGETLVGTGAVAAKQVAQALRAQMAEPARTSAGVAGAVKETVKVDADRLDRLLDAIGELVIAESMIQGSPELKGKSTPKLAQQMGQLDKIARELQEMGTSLRMVPVRPTFQKMARLVRDLSKQGGKAVNFITVGEETELDKTVVEKIGDPLVHMLRNSLDHGIESDASAREAAGKPAVATVKLSAFQKGGSVCIEISDDGRGLNREAILAKARERGILRDDPNPPDREVWNYIFEAGFSTAPKVTELSGRGVGMDVVKRNIEALRGRIDIQSRPGQGTVFSIWLPLTLAIIDGMVVRIGRERYVFPTLSIVRIVTCGEGEILTVKRKGEMLSIQGEFVPLFPLHGYFHPGEGRDGNSVSRLVLIAETEGRKVAFPVDELLGQQQIVIKKLEEGFPDIAGVSGGAILPDGCVGLILDLDGLMKLGF